jgi:hypothetical protein
MSRGIENKTTIIVVKGKENRREIVKTNALLRATKLLTIATGNKVTNKRGKANPIALHKATAPKRVPATTAARKGMKHVNAGNAFTMKNKNLKHHRQTTPNILP